MSKGEVFVNGSAKPLAPGTTVADLIAELSPLADGCAAALNGAVVRRAEWAQTSLRAGDRIEIVAPAAGG